MAQITTFCVIATTNGGPQLHEFESERKRLEWLADQDDSFEDFYSFEVKGTIDGLTIPKVGRHAKDELDHPESNHEHRDSIVVAQDQLQWLILPDESEARYTNWGDGRKGDASELVTRVNADPAINQGHSDWRLPSVDELKSLIGTDMAPKKGWYWSSTPHVGNSNFAWYVHFYYGFVAHYGRNVNRTVRLVRASQ